MISRWAAVLALGAVLAFAQGRRTVEEVVSFVKSAVQQKESDSRIAASLAGIRMVSPLTEATITELQRSGAGPKTVAALEKLKEQSASLPAAAPAAPAPAVVSIPPPEPAEQRRVLEEVRENALNYTKNLPNYICTQVTRRHVDPTGSEGWRTADTVIEQLTFFEQRETYKVILVNNSPVTNNLGHDQLGGATSSGEFGSILHSIFAPETRTEFGWERWTTLRKRRTYVFSFHTGETMYQISHGPSKQSIHTRTHGSVFVDRDTKTVMRIHMECEGIPADFPIQSVSLDLDYDYGEIAGQEFLLPLHADIRSREGRMGSWNEVSYVSYRKFGTETNITFDTPEVPADKLKEQPDSTGSKKKKQ